MVMDMEDPATIAIDAALSHLQPIRDLARNWDIDIASCLEDYLREVVSLNNSGNVDVAAALNNTNRSAGADAAPNFARAALLLQNSSCVYGRKVEYLHGLVYAALHDLIASTRQQQKSGSGGKKKRSGADADVDEFHDFDPDMEFLLLDDVLPVVDENDARGGANAIDLEEEEDDDDHGMDDRLNRTSLVDLDGTLTPAALNDTDAANATRLSLGGLSVTRLDASALLPGTAVQLGDLSSSAARTLLASLLTGGASGGGGDGDGAAGNGGSLRLLHGRCDVGADGTLLLPGASLGGGTIAGGRGSFGGGVRIFTDEMGGRPSPAVATAGSDTPRGAMDASAEAAAVQPMDAVGFDDDNDDGGVGFELHDGGDDDDDQAGPPAQDDAPRDDPQQQQGRRVTFAADSAVAASKSRPAKADPWSLLDPHDDGSGGGKPKPLKIGVTYRLPPSLDGVGPPSSVVTGARTRIVRQKNRGKGRDRTSSAAVVQNLRPGDDNPCLAQATFQAALAREELERRRSSSASTPHGGKEDDVTGRDVSSDDGEAETKGAAEIAIPAIPLTGLAFGDEFAYIARATAKRKAAERREERRRQLKEGGAAVTSEEAAATTDGYDGFDDDDDDYHGGGFDFGGGDDDDSIGGGGELDGGNAPRSNVDLSSIDDAFAGAVASGRPVGDGDFADDADSQTFEELCRAHIRAFARGAEKYAAETQLTRRVGTWQCRLAPILEEEERRPEFDIHVYGDRILSSVKHEIASKKTDPSCDDGARYCKSNVVDFRAVTKDSEQYEVCRLFLSSLMLCNTGNVIISHQTNGGGASVSSPDALQIELLDSRLEMPMETYLAPSALEEENASATPVAS